MNEGAPQATDRVRAHLNAPGRPDTGWFTQDLASLRAAVREEFRWSAGPFAPVASRRQLDAGGVPAILFHPSGGEREVLVWIHGGGFTVGDAEGYEEIARDLAVRAGVAVLSVDYRLAPEHPYPAAIDDAWAATRWAAKRFDQVAVGGDSAGGALTAAVALRARDAGLSLALQLLVYPALEPRFEHPVYQKYAVRYDGFAGIADYGTEFHGIIERAWDNYVPDELDRHRPDAAPLRAPSLAGVAPAYLVIAGHDLLAQENRDFADRLRGDGVPTGVDEWPDQVHGFFLDVGRLEDARDAAGRAAAVLRAAFDAV